MGSLESHTQVFIVRFWQEPRELAGTDVLCRGVIEHVASGTRHYVTNLDEAVAFMAPLIGGTPERRSLGARLRRLFRMAVKVSPP